MDTMRAFMMGEANRGKPQRIFDWDKAAQMIRDRDAEDASAGLSEDWGATGGPIWTAGKPVSSEDTYVYLASTWATPSIVLDGDVFPCWRWEKVDEPWSAHTYWPESAVAILSAAKDKQD